MQVNSLGFLLFFSIVSILYFAVGRRFQMPLLLAASIVFAGAEAPEYLAVLLFVAAAGYLAAIAIEKSAGGKRKLLLAAGLLACLLALGFFKYFNFFSENAHAIAALIGWNYPIWIIELALPLGLSFYTIQTMGYLADVYQKKCPPEKEAVPYALFVSFYPKFVAGPIERAGNLLPQLHAGHAFSYEDAKEGLLRMLLGLFKKVVIADRLAVVVNTVYGSPHDFLGLPLAVATIFFAFQLYADFSGYADIAIGAARVLGIRLTENFKRPYFSRHPSEFWRRWHISLSSWIRDYVYIPLGGSRVGAVRHYANLMAMFLIVGLWHGAAWMFVAWGAMHGAYLVVFAAVRGKLGAIGKKIETIGGIFSSAAPALIWLVSVGVTFALVCFAWIFFRAATIDDALYIATHLSPYLGQDVHIGLSRPALAFICVALAALIASELASESEILRALLAKYMHLLRPAAYFAMALAILLFGMLGTTQFIYAQF